MVPFKKLGRYEITKELGRGGMGIVLQARDPMIDRLVALKIIKFEESLEAERKSELLERFFIEAKAAGKLTHQNIVTIYDVAREEETYYIAMEFLEGKNLAETLRPTKKLPFERATKIILQVAAGLKFAHEKQIIHRDIKPGNVILMAEDHVKILDFGLARLQSASTLTQTGHAVGSPQYMSPEQVRGQSVDGRTDIFSMGVMYYEMLTGTRPFEAESVTSLLYKIMDYDPPTPAMVEGSLPPGVDRVVAKMMAKKVENRYPNCGELIGDLNSLLADPSHFSGGDGAYDKTVSVGAVRTDVTVTVPTQGAGGKSKMGVYAAVALAAALAAGGALYISSGKKEGRPPAPIVRATTTQTPAPPSAAKPVSAPEETPKPALTAEAPPTAPGPEVMRTEKKPAPQKAPSAAAAGPEEKKPGSASISVSSNVPGEVFINGARAGATPMEDFACEPGVMKLTVKAENYKPWEKTVTAKPGEPLRLQATLEPSGGVLKIASTPPGADVLVDGAKIGVTPLLTSAVAHGAHALEVRAAGMAPYKQEITVTAEKPVIVTAALAPATGTLSVTGFAGAALFLNGKEIGAIPLEKKLPPGKYELKATKAGHKPASRHVEVTMDNPTEVLMELEPLGTGSLNVSAIPWAKILINGQEAGTTPKTVKNVPEGEVVVTLVNPGFKPVEKTVAIVKDQTAQVSHTFIEADSAGAARPDKPAAGAGSLRVTSEQEALVFVDGKLQGRAPVEVKNLPVGRHKLLVKISGKPDHSQEVNIGDGINSHIHMGK
jgi:serine/threonine-protein kinase